MIINKEEIIGMPVIGFGTWQIPREKARDLVSDALGVGYNHIDCAAIYGNEDGVGEALTKVDRSKVFVTSKLWADSHDPSKVKAACEKSLKDLQLDYLDLYLIHGPYRTESGIEGPKWYDRQAISDTWREMIKLKESGLAKNVGVSNFTVKKLEYLIEDGEIPSNNQIELHPYLQQKNLLKFCKENKISVTAYSPLGSPGTKISFPQIMTPDAPELFNDPIINKIAQAHGVTQAQVLLKWGIDRGTPVLCKSSSKTRMIENLNSLKVELTKSDTLSIDSIDIIRRYLSFKPFIPSGKTVAQFWDEE